MDSTKKNIGSIHGVVKQLEELFDTFNNHLFNGELQKPVITVSPDVTRGAYAAREKNKESEDVKDE